MPLRVDDKYRGPRALHVRSHRKLGKHRTLITPALSILNRVVENAEVTKVDLGKVVGSHESAKFTPRVGVRQLSAVTMRVLLVARNCAQPIDITAKSEEALKLVLEDIEREWPHYQAAND